MESRRRAGARAGRSFFDVVQKERTMSARDDKNRGAEQPQGEAWPSAGVGSRPREMVQPEAAPTRALAAVGFLLDAVRRRRSGRIALWGIVVLLALGGLGMISYPFLTDVYAGRVQNRLDRQLAATSVQQGITAFKEKSVPVGNALTRLRIPKLKINVVVVEGTTGNALRAGAGHYVNSALPGDSTGNVAIAGHRTGFGQPFRHLERLREGDRMQLSTPFGTYTYEVMGPFDGHANPWITGPKDWSVISPTPEPVLTLTSCDPPGTSDNRLIVRARLIESKPRA
jgi:LPXTG-site transpeptidase (sortase) family protein